MISNNQLNQLKEQLQAYKKELNSRLDEERSGYTEGESAREATGELSAYDNHPADMGTETFERGKDIALKEHASMELEKANQALEAMEEGTYGKCLECGEDIPYERLEIVPSTLYCVDHTPDQTVSNNRPAEEDFLERTHNAKFQHNQSNENVQRDDSFQEVARFGTSETPGDFYEDQSDYNDLYKEDTDSGFTEEYESFSANDIDGKNRRVYPSDSKEEYEDTLDQENLESPIGDIPYKRKDSYVENNRKK